MVDMRYWLSRPLTQAQRNWCRRKEPELTMVFFIVLVVSANFALAHDMYGEWKDALGISCCHDKDCRPTRAEVVGDHWEAIVDGHTIYVPMDRVLPIPSPDGRSHICIRPGGWIPQCFVPGEIRS